MRVSVAMCTYNGEKYLAKQLNSILAQSVKVDEIIISDDNSQDGTILLCEQILSSSSIPYQIIKNKKALGVKANFKQCFSLCSGDIIFSCDQDDIWENNKVKSIIAYFKKQPKLNLIASDATLIDANDQGMRLSLQQSLEFSVDSNNTIFDNLLRTYCITGATMAFRKSFFEKAFYLSEYWLHDGWLALGAALNDCLLFVPEKLTRYRLHGNNQCGVGNVELLAKGSVEQLRKTREKALIKTALRYPFYFEDYAQERALMFKEIQTQALRQNWEVNSENMAKLASCIDFWQQRSNIRNLSYHNCKKMIKLFKDNNAYQKYSESKKLSYFDKYFWLVYKCVTRRNRAKK
ncbi:MAG: glycosyltransferase family 2 protein [Erysipelotrichaceae bacterium]